MSVKFGQINDYLFLDTYVIKNKKIEMHEMKMDEMGMR